MTNMTDQDWELASAYCDDELDASERATFEARLQNDPMLRKVLDDIQMVSDALSAMKPKAVPNAPVTQPPANRNWRPLALCASVALAAVLTAGIFLFKPEAPKTPLAWHSSFVTQSYQVPEPGMIQNVQHGSAAGLFDLEVANLFLVDQKELPDDQLAAHYSGRNGCRLTVLSGINLPNIEPSDETRIGAWEVGEQGYAVIATGMDERRFDAIENLLRQMTRSASQPSTVLAAKMASDNAAPCQQA